MEYVEDQVQAWVRLREEDCQHTAMTRMSGYLRGSGSIEIAYNEHPDFEEHVLAGLDDILRAAHDVVGADVEEFTPGIVYWATNAMNAALASFSADLMDRDDWMRPYRGGSFETLSEKLIGYNVIDRGHIGDRRTTDLWARELDLVGWYRWKALHD